MAGYSRWSLWWCVVVAALVASQAAGSRGQITFSRDWNAGKRAAAGDCADALKPAVGLCHALLTEIKHMVVCELRAARALRFAQLDEPDPSEDQSLFAGSR